MASNDQKTELLFKQFNNVVNARQEASFSTLSQNKFPFRNYVLNESIFSNTIPKNLSDISYNSAGFILYGTNALDLSFSNSAQPLGISYEIPNTDLVFYYKAELQLALDGFTPRTWYIDDNLGNNDSLIKDTIPFLYDASYISYAQTLYDKTGNAAYGLYESPLYWLLDYQSGFVQFYGDEAEIELDVSYNGPYRFSFIKYNGPKGASGGGGGGGGDASFNNIDISGDIILQDNNLMQSLTINGWTVPSTATYYIIATVPETGANAFGYFTIQLQDAYYQQVSFYAGVMENKNSVIKVISNTNQDIAPSGYIGFKNLQIILYSSVYYLVTIFEPVSGTQISLLKIILTNNNSNGKDQINLDRYWTLRNDPDTDWTQTGPQPPGPWTPAVGPQPALPPPEVTVSLANTNAIFGGNPHGMTTQPEYFQSDIVMGPNGNIVAKDGTGTIDICGNLYVDRDASFNQGVFIRDSLDISNNVDIGGNLTVDNLATFTGIDNSNNEIKTNTLFVAANNSSNGNNMTTEVIPRIGPNIVSDNYNHGGNTFEYYKLGSINTIVDSSLNYFACNGFFELNYYYTGGDFNGGGNSATMQMIRFMVGGTSRKESGTTYTDNLYIKILSNQYQGPNTTDIKFQDLVLITNVSNQLILYSKIWKPQATPSARYSIRIYQDTNDVNGIHNPNTSWKLYELNDAYVGTSIPTSPTIINRYEIDLSLQAPDLSSPIDGMDMKYIDTCGNDLKNSNVINTQPEFFQQYTKFNKGIDINNTKIINNRGLLGKDQSVIGNNVGASPNTDDMYIESLGVASDIYIKVQPEHNIKFVGRDSTTGNESTNSIDINPLNSGIIDMDFNGTNNIKGVNNIEAAYYGDISANDISANHIFANDISANDISANRLATNYINIYSTGNSNLKNIRGTDSGELNVDPKSLIIDAGSTDSSRNLVLKSGKNTYLQAQGGGDSKVVMAIGPKSQDTFTYDDYPSIVINQPSNGLNEYIKLNTATSYSGIIFDVSKTPIIDLSNTNINNHVPQTFNSGITVDLSNNSNNIPSGSLSIINDLATDVSASSSNHFTSIPMFYLNDTPSDINRLALIANEVKFDIYNNYLTATWNDPQPTEGAFDPSYISYVEPPTEDPGIRYWGKPNGATLSGSRQSVGSTEIYADLAFQTAIHRRANPNGNLLPTGSTPQLYPPRKGSYLTSIHLTAPLGLSSTQYFFDCSGDVQLSIVCFTNNNNYTLATWNASELNSINELFVSLKPEEWIPINDYQNMNGSSFLRLKVSSTSGFTTPPTGTPNYFGIRYGAINDGDPNNGGLNPPWSISCLTGYVTFASFPFNLEHRR